MKKSDAPVEHGAPAHKTGSGKDATERSFEKETRKVLHDSNREETGDEDRRSLLGAPVDPNSPTTKGNVPPGVDAADVADPGRATPGSGPVDNRSGEPSRSKK